MTDGAVQAIDGHHDRSNAHAANQDALKVPGQEVGQVDVEYVLGYKCQADCNDAHAGGP